MRLVAQPDCKSGVSARQVRFLPLPRHAKEAKMSGEEREDALITAAREVVKAELERLEKVRKLEEEMRRGEK